jgi:hypothetical protein
MIWWYKLRLISYLAGLEAVISPPSNFFIIYYLCSLEFLIPFLVHMEFHIALFKKLNLIANQGLMICRLQNIE